MITGMILCMCAFTSHAEETMEEPEIYFETEEIITETVETYEEVLVMELDLEEDTTLEGSFSEESTVEESIEEETMSVMIETVDQNPENVSVPEASLEEIELSETDILDALFAPSQLSIDRTLTKGMRGDDVYAVQERLYELGYLTVKPDGIFGNYTEAAVNAFQKNNGLSYQDGMVGNWTIGKLNGDPQPYTVSSSSSGSQITLSRVLSKGMTGTDVLAVQQRLYELGYLTATPDGIFGNYTEAAVKAFQGSFGASHQDGLVGNWTIGKLNCASPVQIPQNNDPSSFTLVRNLYKGLRGDDVQRLQEILYEYGYLDAVPDGIFGNYTQAAVNRFQKEHGLSVPDGIVGNWTAGKLNQLLSSEKNEPSKPLSTADTRYHLELSRDLSKGMRGDDVLTLQNRLAELGFLSVEPDGIFGNYTLNAVKAFQTANGLEEPTGVVSTWTVGKLNGNPVNQLGSRITATISAAGKSTRISRSLTLEMEGDDVLALQKRLSELGYLCVVPKGYFGNMTLDAVLAFQKDHGLSDPTGIVDKWTIDRLNATDSSETVSVPRYVFSALAENALVTDKNYEREGYEIRYIIPHHMAGKMTGKGCANYFVNNGLNNSANYCVGYDGDIAVGVPEDFGAWTSSWWAADEQGITIEVSDEANGTDIIADNAVKSLIYLCADLIRRNPSLGTSMVYDPGDEQIVKAAKKANNPSGLNAVKGNILLHNWTSGGTTTCPGQDMKDKLPIIATKVNEILANPNAVLDLSEITKITQDKHKQQEEEQKEKEEQEEEQKEQEEQEDEKEEENR